MRTLYRGMALGRGEELRSLGNWWTPDEQYATDMAIEGLYDDTSIAVVVEARTAAQPTEDTDGDGYNLYFDSDAVFEVVSINQSEDEGYTWTPYRGSIPKVAGSSWRAFPTGTPWDDFKAVIFSDGGPSGRKNYEVYLDGNLIATRDSLAAAKAVVEEKLGDVEWGIKRLEQEEVVHYYFGRTTEFGSPTTIWVAGSLDDLEVGIGLWWSESRTANPALVEYVRSNSKPAPTLYRGYFFYDDNNPDEMVDALLRDGWNIDPSYGNFVSFSTDKRTAEEFADQADYAVVLEVQGLQGVPLREILDLGGWSVEKEEWEWLVPGPAHLNLSVVQRDEYGVYLRGTPSFQSLGSSVTAGPSTALAYRGIQFYVTYPDSLEGLELLAAGSERAFADWLIAKMVNGSSYDAWTGEPGTPMDSAGRWWTNAKREAVAYAGMPGQSDYGPSSGNITIPVVMTAEYRLDEQYRNHLWDGADTSGGGFFHLDPGTPINIIEFEVNTPTRQSAQELLDAFGQDGDAWGSLGPADWFTSEYRTWKLPIPRMQTTAFSKAAGKRTVYRGLQYDWIEISDYDWLEGYDEMNTSEIQEAAVEHWIESGIYSYEDMEKLLREAGSHIGSHWTTYERVARQYANSASTTGGGDIYGYEDICVGVLLRAEVDESDILSHEEGAEVLRDSTILDWGDQEGEVPIRPGAPITITGAEFMFSSNSRFSDIESFDNDFNLRAVAGKLMKVTTTNVKRVLREAGVPLASYSEHGIHVSNERGAPETVVSFRPAISSGMGSVYEHPLYEETIARARKVLEDYGWSVRSFGYAMLVTNPIETTAGRSGDEHKECSDGVYRWGLYGSAGVLFFRDADGERYYFLQHRSPSVDSGGTWGIPGGALDQGEDPVVGAMREFGEEVGFVPSHRVVKVYEDKVTDDWSYTTILAQVQEEFDHDGSTWEGETGGWFTLDEMVGLNLHPGFASSLGRVT